MRSIVKFTTKLSLVSLAFCISMSNVFANTLSEVEINAVDSGYGIVLKTDEAAQMKKIVSSDNKMTIELKDVKVSEDINTVYNNVANIDNVTISPVSKNDIKIVFKGKDISNSKVSFEPLKTDILAPVVQETKQSIELSAPVSSYTPVYNPQDFVTEEIDQTANPQLNEVLTKMHISREMLLTVKRYTKAVVNKLNNAVHGDINFMTIAGIIIVIGAFLFKPSRKQTALPKREKTIGLEPRENIEREIGLNRSLADNMNINRVSVPSAAKAGYGMRAYQQSQKNPYTSINASTNGVSGIARRKPLSASSPIKKQTLKAQPITKESAPLKMNKTKIEASQLPNLKQMKNTTPAIQPVSNIMSKMKAKEAAPSDLDSMKFLESITKIYENSGRSDLAKGLKDNLRKAQLTHNV